MEDKYFVFANWLWDSVEPAELNDVVTLAEVLERQAFLQRRSWRNTGKGCERTYPSEYVCIPMPVAEKIVQALRRAPKSRGGRKRSWGERQINNILMDKALSYKDALVSKGEKAVNAEIEAAEWIKKADRLERDVETIRRAMQVRSAAINFDAKSGIQRRRRVRLAAS
jgi:hypothetical protein